LPGFARRTVALAITLRQPSSPQSSPMQHVLATAASTGWTPPKPIRAVLSDVDGTLFPYGTSRPLSAANIAALSEAVSRGVHVGLATGRIPGPWSEQIHAALPGLGASVYGNGGLVVDNDGKVLFEASLPTEAVERVRGFTTGGRAGDLGRLATLATTRAAGEAASDGYSVRYVELAPDGPTFASQLIHDAGEPAVRVEDFPADMPSVIKFVMFTDPTDDAWAPMPATIKALRAVLEGTGATVLDCGARQCEIFAPGVNKGSGAARLAEHLGVSLDSVLALGDAENDVEMLTFVGAGVAMGNANAKAKGAADVVVGTSDDDGVAEALRRFVLV